MLGFDNNGSNSAQESSPKEESNDSSGNFSANKWSTSKKMAQNVVFYARMAPEEAFEQGDRWKNIHPTNSELAQLK